MPEIALLILCSVSALACVGFTWAMLRSASLRERAARVPVPPTVDLGDLAARVTALEASLPRFQLEMLNLVDTAHEILNSAEKKRARAAAHASREKRAEEQQELAASDPVPVDRAEAKREVLRRLGRA